MEKLKIKFHATLTLMAEKRIKKSKYQQLYSTNNEKYLMLIINESTEYEKWINNNYQMAL